MSTLTILYQNYADLADFTDGGYNASFPISNVKNDDLGTVARTSNSLNAATRFVCNLGASRTVGGVAVGPCNISPGATYRVRAYSNSGLTTLVNDSGILTVAGSTIDWSNTANWLAWEDPGFWEGIPNVFDQDDVSKLLIYIPNDNVAAQYWYFEIFDEANADGYLQYGRVFISRRYRPDHNYEFGDNAFSPNQPIKDVSETLGGKKSIWYRGKRRIARFGFKDLPETDLFGDVFNLARNDLQMVLIPDPGDIVNLQRRSFISILKEAPAIVQAGMSMGSTAIDFEEVI